MNLIQKKLHIAKSGVHLVGHKYAHIVRALHEKSNIQLVETQTDSEYAKYDFADTKSTSTYDGCASLWLRADEKLRLVIYNGDAMYGEPTTHRVTFVFTGNWWLIPALNESVETEFKNFCWRALFAQEEEARHKRAEGLGEHFLAVFDNKVGEEHVGN